ncbi:MAG TPA: hypothetical protein V6D27_00850 [Vampirovibrionales bacterium]
MKKWQAFLIANPMTSTESSSICKENSEFADFSEALNELSEAIQFASKKYTSACGILIQGKQRFLLKNGVISPYGRKHQNQQSS